VTVGHCRPRTAHDIKMSAADGIGELIGATSILRSELTSHEATCRKALSEVRVDHEITGVLTEIHAGTWRSAISDVFRGFEAARHRLRLLEVAMEVEDGRSIGEVAKSWVYPASSPRGGCRRAPASRSECRVRFPRPGCHRRGPFRQLGFGSVVGEIARPEVAEG
jgi:hypothetical protein